MAEITEHRWPHGDYHYCANCGNWCQGFSKDEKVVVFIAGGIGRVVPVDDFNAGDWGLDEEFDVWDHTKTRRTCHYGCQTIVEDSEIRITDVMEGDTVYECDECGDQYPHEDQAENCC